MQNVFKRFKNLIAAQEGPPDLDELFRDLKNKFKVFRGGKKSQGPRGSVNEPNSNGADSIPLGPIMMIIFLIWLATGFYIVDQGSRGIVLRFG